MPLALASVVHTSNLGLLHSFPTRRSSDLAAPLRVSEPADGIVVIFTASRVLAGLSFGSVKSEEHTVRVHAEVKLIVRLVLVPAGASFTLLTLKVSVVAGWSRSSAPLAVPPLSYTWNVTAR